MSKPKHLFFDTCYYIDRFHGYHPPPKTWEPKQPFLIIGHSIVMMELYQGVRTEIEREAILKIEKSLHLIGPSVDSYLEAGQILKGMTDKKWLNPKRLYETQNDVLLALSTIENEAWIVTRNKKDFEKIRKFCPASILYYD